LIIDFRKVPSSKSNFQTKYLDLDLSGVFHRDSGTTVFVDALLNGKVEVDCCRCGEEFSYLIDDNIKFLISDGVFSDKTVEDDIIVIETKDKINFDTILQSEIDSIQSDYHICNSCQNKEEIFEKEF